MKKYESKTKTYKKRCNIWCLFTCHTAKIVSTNVSQKIRANDILFYI